MLCANTRLDLERWPEPLSKAGNGDLGVRCTALARLAGDVMFASVPRGSDL